MAVNLFLLRFSYEEITLYTVFRTRKFITSLVGVQNTNKIFHHYSFSIPHKNSNFLILGKPLVFLMVSGGIKKLKIKLLNNFL